MVAKIKFCGIMRPADAAVAAEAGAGYLGVVFAGGPRAVSTVEAGEVRQIATRMALAAGLTPDNLDRRWLRFDPI